MNDFKATEELRRLLDERGVVWDGESHTDATFWNEETNLAVASDDRDGKLWVSMRLTPEQAVEATMGRGECRLVEVDIDGDTASEYMKAREWCFDAVYKCSCGCRFGHVAHDRPRYCPNCGRKVVDA